ncbi:MAG: hypothetical protein ACRES7_06160 [Gammaproteobacteria bacterium]
MRSRLRRFLRKNAIASCSSLVLADGVEGFVHVETALLRPEGIYLLETLEGEGRLIAGERLAEWTLSGKRRFIFPNPLSVLEHKIAAARLAAGTVPLEGFLVIDDRLEFQLTCPKGILTFAQLVEQLPPLEPDMPVRAGCSEAWIRLQAAPRAA